MAEPIVVNTGPLVSFVRIGCLDVIGRLPYEFLCPAEVWQELDEGRASGHPWAAPAWLKKKPLVKPPSPALLAGLDLGEPGSWPSASRCAITYDAVYSHSFELRGDWCGDVRFLVH